ncbi:hypothetical protein L6232_24795, partial [Shewanella sp. C31]|nr:hypothetical protein [Shewanella electrica]
VLGDREGSLTRGGLGCNSDADELGERIAALRDQAVVVASEVGEGWGGGGGPIFASFSWMLYVAGFVSLVTLTCKINATKPCVDT